jgi:hypothetical protein
MWQGHPHHCRTSKLASGSSGRSGAGARLTAWLVPGVRTPFAARRRPRCWASTRWRCRCRSPRRGRAAFRRPDVPDLRRVGNRRAGNLGWEQHRARDRDRREARPSTPAFSTVLACSTSMVAVFEAAGMLRNDMRLALCGGVESMSRVQIGLRQGSRTGSAAVPGAQLRRAHRPPRRDSLARRAAARAERGQPRHRQEHGRALRGDGEAVEHRRAPTRTASRCNRTSARWPRWRAASSTTS